VLEPTGKSCKYGRECAYLRRKGEDVAEILIREGHAAPYGDKGPRGNRWS